MALSAGDPSPVSGTLPSLVGSAGRLDARLLLSSSHTAPIGNFGMRTQATRMIDDTRHLNGGTKPAAKNGQFGWPPLAASAPSALHLQPHGPAQLRHRSIAHHDERRVLVAREADEAKRHLPRERWRAVEHHEGEGAAPQQHIGTPGPACGVARAHHAEEIAIERCPVGGIEGARGIDAGDTLAPGQGGTDQCPHQRRRTRTDRTDELGEPPARNPTAQRLIELVETGGDGIGRHRRWGDDLLESGPKLGYLHKYLLYNYLRK
jgi:hypothetical protein